MKFLGNLVTFILLCAILAVGMLFAVQNSSQVPLDLLVIYLPARSVALWVLLAFAVGGAIGMLTSVGLMLRLRTALLQANRKLNAAEKLHARERTRAAQQAGAVETQPVVETGH